MLDFDRPADVVAPRLLGGVVRKGDVAIRLTEVEAYLGPLDPASHAYRGNRGRAAVMYGPSAHLYVYLNYGIHRCGNLVCSPVGEASGVLMRAGEVVAGLDLARARRALAPGRPDDLLAKGPGNLGRALGLDLADSGAPLGGPDDEFEFIPAEPASSVLVGPRVGVSRAAERQWRFWLPGEPSVSAYRRGSPMKPSTSGHSLQRGVTAD
ncbi:DNA-3-methyladenine glycosylase [Propionibacterium cyclohexanicum]|uniref:DNA-3-methyladenine glycosylase n=1 Tax=Propionibacterium cyclohexanicum TaxID=64702 RepID=UPI000B89B450|nr:DNA-3-methyladenine glycosylase [Propionibacterium cyclohexanicum]